MRSSAVLSRTARNTGSFGAVTLRLDGFPVYDAVDFIQLSNPQKASLHPRGSKIDPTAACAAGQTTENDGLPHAEMGGYFLRM
jgi:hypothetical protein